MAKNEDAYSKNIELATIFHNMAKCYRYLGIEERYRAIAYENASKTLFNMQTEIEDYESNLKSLEALPTIGESIAEKIIEYIQFGKILAFEKLQKKVPYELLELLDIKGFGVTMVKKLYTELNINNKETLIEYIKQGKLDTIEGFGKNRIDTIKRNLKLLKDAKRISLNEATAIADKLVTTIAAIPNVQNTLIAGSIRRKKSTIGDIDIVVIAALENRKKIVAQLVKILPIKKVLAKGLTKVSAILQVKNIQLDIRLVQQYELGAAMLYSTGSKEHTIKLRIRAKNMGYKMNEYGLFEIATNKRIAGNTEKFMYNALNLKFIPPEQRNDTGEIEKADLDKKKK